MFHWNGISIERSIKADDDVGLPTQLYNLLFMNMLLMILGN